MTTALLVVVFIWASAERFGRVELADARSKHLSGAVDGVALAGVVLCLAVTRQRWRIERDHASAHVALVMVLVGLFSLAPSIATSVDDPRTTALALGGHGAGLVVATTLSMTRTRSGQPSLRPLILLIAGSLVIGAILSWSFAPVSDQPQSAELLFEAFAIAWVILAGWTVASAMRHGSFDPPWIVALYMALAVASTARAMQLMTVDESNFITPHALSASVALLIGIGMVFHANLLELATTSLAARDEALAARAETRRAVDRLVAQTQSQHETRHDTRTAIAVIQASLAVLRDRPEVDRDWLLGEIRSEVARLDQIIDTPRGGEVIASFNVGDVLGPMISCYRAVEQPVRLAGDIDLLATGRPGATVEAVQNLVDNALSYSRATAITVTIAAVEHEVSITVSDNGIGIPASESAAVFRHGSRGSTAIGPGTGVGLYLVRSMMQAQNGSAELVGTPVGTSIELRLPLTRWAESPASQQSPDAVIDLRESVEGELLLGPA